MQLWKASSPTSSYSVPQARAAKRPCTTLCFQQDCHPDNLQIDKFRALQSENYPLVCMAIFCACLEIGELWLRLQSNSPVRKQPRGRYKPGIRELILLPVHRRTTNNQCYTIEKSMKRVSFTAKGSIKFFEVPHLGGPVQNINRLQFSDAQRQNRYY